MPRDPVREWQELYARRGTQLSFTPMTGYPFFSSVKLMFDAPPMVRTRMSPGVMFRDRSMLRDKDDKLSLVIAETPRYHAFHRGRDVELDRGEAVLFQADGPGKAGSPDGFASVEIRMPPAEWMARGVRPGDLLARSIRRNSEGLGLLSGYVHFLEARRDPAGPQERDAISRHVIDLAVLAATWRRPLGESTESAVMSARRAAVVGHIDSRFMDPDLSIASVANALRLSARHIQRLFHVAGTSFTAYVTELRLQKAFALLTASDERRRVADIMTMAGFSDISHFNRLFRSRFGDTPNGLRGEAPPMVLPNEARPTGSRALGGELSRAGGRTRERRPGPFHGSAVTIGSFLDLKSAAGALLDSLSCAVVLTDAELGIVHANTAAGSMLADGGLIQAKQGRLNVAGQLAENALLAAVRRAAGNEACRGQSSIGIPARSAADAPAILHVLPLRFDEIRIGMAQRAVAAIFVASADRDADAPMDAIAVVYDLTPTESQVFAGLARGQSLTKTADALGVARSTTRTHLLRIFEKTGCKRQAELVALAAKLSLRL